MPKMRRSVSGGWLRRQEIGGLRALTVQFHVARAVMLDEYGRTKEAALAALDEAEAALGPRYCSRSGSRENLLARR